MAKRKTRKKETLEEQSGTDHDYSDSSFTVAPVKTHNSYLL